MRAGVEPGFCGMEAARPEKRYFQSLILKGLRRIGQTGSVG
jgi:hypothetical protein